MNATTATAPEPTAGVAPTAPEATAVVAPAAPEPGDAMAPVAPGLTGGVAPAAPVADEPDYRLHPRIVDVWFWQSLIFVTACALPGAVMLPLFGSWLWLPALALLVTLLVRLLSAYARAYVARFRCRLLPDGLMVTRGVWWHSETFVPRARVQHTDVTQGPIARRFGLAALKVFTAGTHVGEISIEGLAREHAIRLRDELLGRHGRDAL
jgi:hypothetical protein